MLDEQSVNKQNGADTANNTPVESVSPSSSDTTEQSTPPATTESETVAATPAEEISAAVPPAEIILSESVPEKKSEISEPAEQPAVAASAESMPVAEVQPAAEGSGEPTAPPQKQLSKREKLGAEFLAQWRELQDAQRDRKMVEMRVVRKIKGGTILDFKGLDVFMPFSHWHIGHDFNEAEIDLMLGKIIPVRVIEVSAPEKMRAIASRRKLMLEERCAAFNPGDEVKGKVSGITTFGIFVDLDGVEGLVHLSQFAPHRVQKQSEKLKVGDELLVTIHKIDPKRGRVWLNMQDVSIDQWKNISSKFSIGSVYPATVVSLKKFGLFVELDAMIEAFVSALEMSWSRRVRNPETAFKVGDTVNVKILKIKEGSRKIEASIKQVTEDPWPTLGTVYNKGAFCEGKVKQIVEKGAVVELANNVEGFVPRSKMIPRNGGEPPELHLGDVLQLRVVDFSAEEQFIILGIKYEGAPRSGGGPRPDRPRREERSDDRRGERGERRERRDDRPRYEPPQRTGEQPTLGELISEKIRRKLQGSK